MKRKWLVMGLVLTTALFFAGSAFALTITLDVDKRIVKKSSFSLDAAQALGAQKGAIESVYLTINSGFNKQNRGNGKRVGERWWAKVGDQKVKLSRTKRTWGTDTIDLTDALINSGDATSAFLGEDLVVAFWDKKAVKGGINGMKIDSLVLTINYQNDDTPANGGPAPVPEPGTMALLGVGLVALGGAVRKKLS